MTNPMAVPPIARSAVAPVPKALERNTDRVPSTTQKPCDTFVISTTVTARASPAAPRTALRNHTERNERCESSRLRTSVRRPRAGHADPAVPRGLRAGRLERGVGHHPYGDPEHAGTKPGVERAADDVVRDAVGAARARTRGSAFS